jgi:hypothetical protein
MSDQASSGLAKLGIGVVVCVIIYNLFSGFVAKKVGIPGLFEIEFGPKTTYSPTPGPVNPTPAPQVTNQPSAPPLPNPTMFSQPPAPVANYACPTVPGVFWMQYPNTWWGPFGGGYAIGWYSGGGFGVWNPYIYQTVNYPDPYRQTQRNTWLRLTNSPFNICIDSHGNVYGQYAP